MYLMVYNWFDKKETDVLVAYREGAAKMDGFRDVKEKTYIGKRF